MPDGFISRGFVVKPRQPEVANRVPPGQYATRDFPVLSAGPTPRLSPEKWSFTIEGAVREPVTWTWTEFLQLPLQKFVVDIHCVTKWTKLDTHWEGVSVDTLLEHLELDQKAHYVTAFCEGGYTTNIPLPDLLNGQAFVAFKYDEKPLTPQHAGPARLVVPHLYFWKSAKWVRGLRLTEKDKRGFWESLGYNNHGDPWKEERYSG